MDPGQKRLPATVAPSWSWLSMPGPAWYVARDKHNYFKVIYFSGISPISSCPGINGIIQRQLELTIRGHPKEASLFLTEENLEVFHVSIDDEPLSV